MGASDGGDLLQVPRETYRVLGQEVSRVIRQAIEAQKGSRMMSCPPGEQLSGVAKMPCVARGNIAPRAEMSSGVWHGKGYMAGDDGCGY